MPNRRLLDIDKAGDIDLKTNSDKGEKYSENAMYKNSERNVFMHRPSWMNAIKEREWLLKSSKTNKSIAIKDHQSEHQTRILLKNECKWEWQQGEYIPSHSSA